MTREQEEKLFAKLVKENALFQNSSLIIDNFAQEEKIEISEKEKNSIIEKLLKLQSLIGRRPIDL